MLESVLILAAVAALMVLLPMMHYALKPRRRCTAIGLLTLLVMCALVIGCGSNDAYGCPPQSLGITNGCQAQAIVQPQAVYAAPVVQQQVVSPFYSQQIVQRVVAQPVIVQQVRQHHAQAIVQQVQVQKVVQPRVQVQRSRTVIRNR